MVAGPAGLNGVSVRLIVGEVYEYGDDPVIIQPHLQRERHAQKSA